MKKVAIYARVSTSGQTVKNQVRELTEYCKRQDWEIVETYEDEGISGSKNDRPALNQMLADAHKGKFSILTIWSVDRLGRSTVNLLNIMQELLQECNVGVVATSQGISTTDSAGRMLVSFLSAIAQFEKEMIISRVKSGLSRAKSEGRIGGRPRRAFDSAKALRMKQDGMGYKCIAKALNVPKSTLYYHLESIRKTQEEKVA